MAKQVGATRQSTDNYLNISNEEANLLLNFPKHEPIDKEAITDLKQKICERDECIMELVKKINKIEKCVQSL